MCRRIYIYIYTYIYKHIYYKGQRPFTTLAFLNADFLHLRTLLITRNERIAVGASAGVRRELLSAEHLRRYQKKKILTRGSTRSRGKKKLNRYWSIHYQ